MRVRPRRHVAHVADVRRVALFTTAALMLGAAVAGAGVWLLTRPAPPSVVRTTITTSGSTALTLSGLDRDVAITPDGSRVVYRGNNQLLVRALDQLEPTVLSGLGAPQAYSSHLTDSGWGSSTGTARSRKWRSRVGRQ